MSWKSFATKYAKPGPKKAKRKAIRTREEIKRAVAAIVIRRLHAGLNTTSAELADESGLRLAYPTATGSTKVIGDAIGDHKDGFQFHFDGDHIRRCAANLGQIADRLPESEMDAVVQEAGLTPDEFEAWVATLPEV